jgi:hypothetical protein
MDLIGRTFLFQQTNTRWMVEKLILETSNQISPFANILSGKGLVGAWSGKLQLAIDWLPRNPHSFVFFIVY